MALRVLLGQRVSVTAMSGDQRDVGDFLVHFFIDIAPRLPQYLGCKAVQPLQVGAAMGIGPRI